MPRPLALVDMDALRSTWDVHRGTTEGICRYLNVEMLPNMSPSDLLSWVALLCSGLGLLFSVLAYKRPDGRTFLYNRSELSAIAKRNTRRHRLAMAGFASVSLGIVAQLAFRLLH